MFDIKEINEQEATKFFMSDPKLILMGLSDSSIVDLYETKSFVKNPGCTLLGVHYKNELVFILKYEHFSPIAINVHMFLKTMLQGTETFGLIQAALREYFITNTIIRKIIAMTPSSCANVGPTCLKFGFKKEGHITNSVMWRNEITDIEIYGLDLEEPK